MFFFGLLLYLTIVSTKDIKKEKDFCKKENMEVYDTNMNGVLAKMNKPVHSSGGKVWW